MSGFDNINIGAKVLSDPHEVMNALIQHPSGWERLVMTGPVHKWRHCSGALEIHASPASVAEWPLDVATMFRDHLGRAQVGDGNVATDAIAGAIASMHAAHMAAEMNMDERIREQLANGVALDRMLTERDGDTIRLLVDGECVASAEVRITGAPPDDEVRYGL